jgi:predicted lipoprotein with Yx(FWY)xxD motif
MRTRTAQLLTAALLVCAASAAIVASAQGGVPSARSSSAATVQLRKTAIGTVLVSSTGHTLYTFSRDHARSDSCAHIRGCLHAWPALVTRSRPTAGHGVSSSMLSTITVNGAKQVTYNGHALYTFNGDSPGETAYVGAEEFGGTWEAINASGRMIK